MNGADALGSRASERAGSTNPDGTPTVVADKARVALGRTGIKAAREGKSKSGFLQKRGPLKVRLRAAVLLVARYSAVHGTMPMCRVPLIPRVSCGIAGMAEAMVRVRGRRTVVLSQLQPGMRTFV